MDQSLGGTPPSEYAVRFPCFTPRDFVSGPKNGVVERVV